MADTELLEIFAFMKAFEKEIAVVERGVVLGWRILDIKRFE
jgi:hypothetical protein